MATFKIYKDRSGEYYWTLSSDKNYKIIAMASESYKNKNDAKDSLEWVRTNAKEAAYEDLT